jgi:hypothetical protein
LKILVNSFILLIINEKNKKEFQKAC